MFQCVKWSLCVAFAAALQVNALSRTQAPPVDIPPVIFEVFPFPELAAQRPGPVRADPQEAPGEVDLYFNALQSSLPKKVDITWYAKKTPSDPSGDQWKAVSHQIEPTSFWPTSVTAISGTEIIVAGLTRRDITVIEKWTIAPPTVSIGVGGEVSLTLKRSVRSGLIKTRLVGKRVVTAMTPNRADLRSVFVQFMDSGDIYRLAVDAETLTLQVSSTTSGMLPVVPELANGLRTHTWSGDHTSHGSVYYFMNTETEYAPVALFDSDKDGTIDSALAVDYDTSILMGLWNHDLYQ